MANTEYYFYKAIYKWSGRQISMKVCSFCGKTQEQVKRMIPAQNSNNANICDKCVAIFMEVLIMELEELKEVDIEKE